MKEIKMGSHVVRMEEDKNAFRILGKPTGKRALGSPRPRWEYYIRMDRKEMQVAVNMRKWINSAQDRDYWRVLLMQH